MLSLEKLLDGLEVNVEAFAVCRVGQDAALSLPALERPSIHYCLQGRGVIRGRGWSPVPFEKHAFIVLPAGAAIVVEPDDGRRRAQECRCQPLAAAPATEGLTCRPGCSILLSG